MLTVQHLSFCETHVISDKNSTHIMLITKSDAFQTCLNLNGHFFST